MTEAADCIDRFASAWGEPDPERRAEMLRAAFAPDFRYSDPMVEEPLTALEPLQAMLDGFQTSMPGAVVQITGPLQERPGFAMARLAFGPAEDPFAHGIFCFETDPQGRITRATGFVDRME